MHYTTLALAAFTTAAAAAGQASIVNNCDFPVYLWSVGDGEATERGAFNPGKTWTEDYEEGTREIKISQMEDGISNGNTQSGLVYAVNDGEVSYDLYHVLGTFFSSLTVETDKEGDSEECDSIVWEDGPKGTSKKTCSSDASVTLTLCADKED